MCHISSRNWHQVLPPAHPKTRGTARQLLTGTQNVPMRNEIIQGLGPVFFNPGTQFRMYTAQEGSGLRKSMFFAMNLTKRGRETKRSKFLYGCVVLKPGYVLRGHSISETFLVVRTECYCTVQDTGQLPCPPPYLDHNAKSTRLEKGALISPFQLSTSHGNLEQAPPITVNSKLNSHPPAGGCINDGWARGTQRNTMSHPATKME